MEERTCTIDGCDRETYARTWCHAHYWRWMRNGTPGTGPIKSRPRRPKRSCSRSDCSGVVLAKGLCKRHYQQQCATGMTAGVCIVEGCGKAKASRQGLCKSHIRYVNLYGTVSERVAVIERISANAVEDANGCWVWQLHVSARGTGYGVMSGTYAHRAAWEAYRGDIPEGTEIDHLCRNSRCVNPYHLEPVPRSENLRRRGLSAEAHMALAYA